MQLTAKLQRLIAPYADATLLEIGVAQGASAEQFLQQAHIARYIGVDPWQYYEAPPDDHFADGYLDRKMGLWDDQAQWDMVYEATRQRLAPYGDRVHLIRGFSHEVARDFAEPIDILYIDGNHQYEYVLQDLEDWYPHVKRGGIILGDDYIFGGGETIDGRWGGEKASQVKAAVEAFCERHRLTHFVVDDQFVIYKPDGRLEQLRHRHAGQRVFLIGNGPSLKQTDLNLIRNDYSIAMNRIAMIYPHTAWRPSYYIYMSDNVEHPEWGASWSQSVNEALNQPETTGLIWRRYAYHIDPPHERDNLVWLTNITEPPIGAPGSFSMDAVRAVAKTGTTMNAAYQLAYFLGFTQFILLGVDMNWRTTRPQGRDVNHFDPSYRAYIPDGERERQRMRRTHAFAYQYLQGAGVSVYNATLNTFVDTFPLVDYQTVANDPAWQGHDRDEDSPAIRAKRRRIRRYWNIERPLTQLQHLPAHMAHLSIRTGKRLAVRVLRRIGLR